MGVSTESTHEPTEEEPVRPSDRGEQRLEPQSAPTEEPALKSCICDPSSPGSRSGVFACDSMDERAMPGSSVMALQLQPEGFAGGHRAPRHVRLRLRLRLVR